MKLFKKINRGLILTIVVVAAVATYLVILSVTQGKEKPIIEDVCTKYISTAISYKQLPDQYKKENPEIPEAELNKYIDSMTADLKAFYTGNEQTYKTVISTNKADLERQASGMGVVFDYKKDIKEFDSFTFDGDTVTVSILTNSVLDGPNIFEPGMPRENISAQTTDTITLQKTEGNWKIIYADLQQPMKSQNGITYRTSGGY